MHIWNETETFKNNLCEHFRFSVITAAFGNDHVWLIHFKLTQAAFTCSKLTIETLELGVKYVQK